MFCSFQGRFVLSNKIARTIVFFYTILLHLLVFLVSFGDTHMCLYSYAIHKKVFKVRKLIFVPSKVSS